MVSCKEWTRAHNDRGYGLVWENGKLIYVHRRAWRDKNGPILKGKCILHKCDNPPCYEETHLFLGSKADNSADMLNKGRSARREFCAFGNKIINQPKSHCPFCNKKDSYRRYHGTN